MAEPTLKDIEQARIDPEIATGQPAVVYDNSQLLDTINKNAQFKAQEDWKKYQQLLGDYQNRLQNQQDIADKPVADSDRDYLKQQSVDLFKDALSDPYKIYSPDFNNKLAGIRADAVSSKLARDYAEENAKFLVTHPEFNTDENKQKIQDYLQNQTVKDGGRKIFTLDIPDVIDTQKLFGGILKDPSVYSKESIDVPVQGGKYIENTITEKYKRQPFIDKSIALLDIPNVKKYAQARYDELPDTVKSQYPKLQDFWGNFAAKYFNSPTDIVNTAKKLREDKNYLKDAELQLKRDKLAIDKMKANAYVKKINSDLNDDEKGVVSYWGGVINSLKPVVNNGKLGVVALAGEIPQSFRKVGGIVVDPKTGKYLPSVINPLKGSGDVKEYWQPKILDNSTGHEVSFDDLKALAEQNYGRKLTPEEATDAIKYLLKNTDAYSLEIQGEGGSKANLESAMQSARLINNATKKKGQEGVLEEPVSDETPQ